MNIICRVIGHKSRYTEPERGIASAWECDRCGHKQPGITWPKPPPPMPSVRTAPACNLRDFYDSALELLSVTQVTAIVAHAKRKPSNDLGNRRAAFGASGLTDGLCGNGNYGDQNNGR